MQRLTQPQLENPASFSPAAAAAVAVTRGLTLKTLETQATNVLNQIRHTSLNMFYTWRNINAKCYSSWEYFEINRNTIVTFVKY